MAALLGGWQLRVYVDATGWLRVTNVLGVWSYPFCYEELERA